MINSVEYGKALYILAQEEGISEQISEQLHSVCEVLKREQDYCRLLDTPAISTKDKPKLIDEAFSGVHIYVLNFLKILCKHRAISQIEECVAAYDRFYDEARNIMRAQCITVIPMKEAQLEALREKLESITGKTVIVKNEVDETLIGGVSLRYDGKQFDGSIKTRLEKLRNKLSQTIV